MDREDFIKTARAMRDARRAARLPLEEEVHKYNSPFAHIKNPWHRFLQVRRFDDGFEFYVFDGVQSLVSTEPSSKNILEKIYDRGAEQFLRRPSSRFFRLSDKKFYVQVNAATLMQGDEAVRYTITDKTIHYPPKYDDPEREEKLPEKREEPLQFTLSETREFLWHELQKHLELADKARNNSAKYIAVIGGSVLTISTLFATCSKNEKPRTPAKHVIHANLGHDPAHTPPGLNI